MKIKSSVLFIFLISAFDFAYSILIQGCKKEPVELVWQGEESYTRLSLNTIHFINSDTGYAYGGDKYFKGIMLKTTDGGNHWSKPDSLIYKTLYGAFFLPSGTMYAVGYDSKILKKTRTETSWKLYQGITWHPLYDIYFVNDSLGFAVGGRGYEDGVILRTQNGGGFWTPQLFDFSLHSILFLDAHTGFAAGYGTILKTEDGGDSWHNSGANGDFFLSLSFPDKSTGYAVGYEGMIIKTTDGGNSWNIVLHGNKPLKKRRHFHAVYFRDELEGIAVGLQGLAMITHDGGVSWREIDNLPGENFNDVILTSSGGFIVGDNGTIIRFEE